MTTATPATPFLAAAHGAVLEDWGALPEATAEPMQTSGVTLWSDGDQEAGVWQCTPGPSRWTLESNEVVHILACRMTVTPDGGEATEIRPGRHRGLPPGLDRHLADPPADPQAVRTVLGCLSTLGGKHGDAGPPAALRPGRHRLLGRVTHAPALASTEGVEFAAVWGRNPRGRRGAGGGYSASAYGDLDLFLASIDAVAFSVPPDVQSADRGPGGPGRQAPAAGKAHRAHRRRTPKSW